MDENEIYEVLGVSPPGDDEKPDGTQQEPAQSKNVGDGGPDPENVSDLDTTDVGEEGATDEGDNGQDASSEDQDGGGEPKAAPPKDSKDKDDPAAQEARWRAFAQQAAARAVEEERAKNQKEWGDFFASAGLKNSLADGKPITSLEEFRQWKSAYDRAKLEQELKEGKLTPEALEAVIRSEVQRTADNDAGRAFGDRPTGGASQDRHWASPNDRSGDASVTQEQIDAELAEIHRLDGSVNGLEDILKLETGGAFQEAVRRGHSFLDAFKLANFDRLQSQRQNEAAQRAAQAARNSARSKEHLRPSESKGGNGSVAVPGDVMEIYRLMMPNASEADITAHYNRMLKDMKK